MQDETNSKKQSLFCWIVALCRLKRRVITLEDILEAIETSPKSLRYLLMSLENDGRIVKTKTKADGVGRNRNAWFPIGRVVDGQTRKISSRDGKCEVCGKNPRIIRVGVRELCRVCMRGFEDADGEWVVVGVDDDTEQTFSRMSICRNPTEA